MSRIYPKITPLFHFNGEKNTVPNCPILMWPHYNPSNGAQFFQSSDSKCSYLTQFGMPFFLEKYGPKFQEWSVTGHEARPGHHTQYQGINSLIFYPVFHTGLRPNLHEPGWAPALGRWPSFSSQISSSVYTNHPEFLESRVYP